MRLVFVDTAGWMAMADESDPHHRAAMRIREVESILTRYAVRYRLEV